MDDGCNATVVTLGGGGTGDSYPELNTPGTTDCWASAGCTGYDGATDSDSYESTE